MLIFGNNLLFSFFQLLLTLPQPAGTAVPSSFPWKLCIFRSSPKFLPAQWGGRRALWTAPHDSSLAAACSVITNVGGICKGLQLLLCVSECAIFLHFYHSQPSLKCGVSHPKTRAGLFKCETPFACTFSGGLLCSKCFHKWWRLFQSGNHFPKHPLSKRGWAHLGLLSLCVTGCSWNSLTRLLSLLP